MRPIVFFDIAGPDSAALKEFYAANFGWRIDAAGMIATPKIAIPSGSFVPFTDPAGNRMGLFEAKT